MDEERAHKQARISIERVKGGAKNGMSLGARASARRDRWGNNAGKQRYNPSAAGGSGHIDYDEGERRVEGRAN